MNQRIEKIKDYGRAAWTYIVARKATFIIGTAVGLLAIFVIALIIYNNRSTTPSVAYQPPRACTLFTDSDAYTLLGNDVINKVNEPKVISNTATSTCSYTDRNPVGDAMKLAAVAIKSGINDEGVTEITDSYTSKKAASNGDAVKGFGNDAYFDPTLGQLNVLNNRDWYIFSYGVGASPQSNTLEDAAKFARLVLP